MKKTFAIKRNTIFIFALCLVVFIFLSILIPPPLFTCWGKNQKLVFDGYPKRPHCYITYDDGGSVCSDGTHCESGICVLSYEDNQAIRSQTKQNIYLQGTCLDSRLREEAGSPYLGCPIMSIHDGQVGKIPICPVF